MKHSHPNRWLYGGVLDRVEWEAGETIVRTWTGATEAVRDGDTLVLIYTGAPAVTVVGVERAEQREEAA